MKGKFLTFEGCEGAGKSTQVRFLKEYCEKNGIDAVFTREPGGTKISEEIREIILFDASNAMKPVTEMMLYAAARAQHVGELIVPALEQGKLVVCDRFFDSTLAYQGFARGLDTQIIRTLNEIATGGLKPDLTIFLNVTHEQGFLRKGGADKNDRLEKEGGEFHKRVYEGYMSIDEPRFVRMDASGTKYETHDKIIAYLKRHNIV